jgi:hypothetical protein
VQFSKTYQYHLRHQEVSAVEAVAFQEAEWAVAAAAPGNW